MFKGGYVQTYNYIIEINAHFKNNHLFSQFFNIIGIYLRNIAHSHTLLHIFQQMRLNVL